MALSTKHKRSSEFSSASMTDLVFLLLIFFILVSTLVSPNAIKLLLPSSNSKTMAKQTTTVYINDQYQFFIEETPITEQDLVPRISERILGDTEATVVVRADKTVPVQYIVFVIDAVNTINERDGTKHKLILATAPKE